MRIQNKMTMLYGFIIAVILIGIYVFLNINLKERTFQSIRSNLEKELFLSKEYFLPSIDQANANTYELDKFADRISNILGVRVTLINGKGVVLGDSELDEEKLLQVENHLFRPEVQQSMKNRLGESQRFSTTVKKNFLYLATTFKKNDFNGFIRLSIPLLEIEEITQSLRKTLLICLFIAFLLCLIAATLGSFLISKPIREISSFAKNLANGNFSQKALIRSKDEIGDLAKAFNEMSQQIQSRLEEVQLEKSKMQAVLLSMFEGVMVLDEHGKIILMNETLQKLLNIQEDPLGKYSLEIIRNMDIYETVKKAMYYKSGVLTKEISLVVSEEKVFMVHATPIIKEGCVGGTVLVFHDITELRRLERIRQDFVANVSHELRTPMTSIKGYAETLLNGALQDKKHAQEFVKIIHFDAERLARLVEDILDLSKMESGVITIDRKEADLKMIVQKTLEFLDRQIKEKKIDVTCKISEKLPKVRVDAEKISQVFFNLVDNAIKYTEYQGQVFIEAHKGDKNVDIIVKDTGMGIPETEISRIFERFYRVDKARSQELGGTGLGLSIVKHILHLHGSTIAVDSVVGQGTIFHFSLPTS